MGFCTTCGAQLADGARFCPKCGTPAPGSALVSGAGAGSGTPPPLAAQTTLDYTIQGDNLQVVRVRLTPGQELFAEAGKMLYKTPSVSWETRMSGSTLGEKLLGALKRKVMAKVCFSPIFAPTRRVRSVLPAATRAGSSRLNCARDSRFWCNAIAFWPPRQASP